MLRDVSSDGSPGCVIITGMPGAGKTTITDLVGRSLPRGAQVSGDVVSLMIRSGSVGFMGKPPEEALRQDELCNRNMCALANNFVDFGFTILMDTVLVDRSELDFFIALMSPRPVRLVVLAPGIEVCKYRNANRAPDQQFDFDGYERLEADMIREFSEAGWWLNTAHLTAQETAERIIAGLTDQASVIAPGWNSWLRQLHGI